MPAARVSTVGIVLSTLSLIVACTSNARKAPAAKIFRPAHAPTSSVAGYGTQAAYLLWFTGGGKTFLTAFSADQLTLQTAAEKLDMSVLSGAAAAIKSEVGAAQAYRPFPSVEGQRQWSAALADLKTSATDYSAFITTQNPAFLTRGSAATGEATAHLSVVAVLIPNGVH